VRDLQGTGTVTSRDRAQAREQVGARTQERVALALARQRALLRDLSLAEDPHAKEIAPYITAGPQHVGFAHPDVDALIARLSGTAEPSDRSDDGKYRRVYFDDPNGIEIEFVQKL
jgi:catechol 2,3-dioxygenase-like lactoylglutathione lyase family enzyme